MPLKGTMKNDLKKRIWKYQKIKEIKKLKIHALWGCGTQTSLSLFPSCLFLLFCWETGSCVLGGEGATRQEETNK